MINNMTLLIMAAGMGSRFGGLKQIEPVGPNGEFIIDYSIYDAIKEGFDKVVFIIKEENYDIFKKTIGSRVEKHISVSYVFQKQDAIPSEYLNLTDRTKPWGTGHAILAAKDVINEPFAIINADDFYGRDAFHQVANFLKNNQEKNHYAVVGYQIANTLTENGSVKRGICRVNADELVEIIESNVQEQNGVIEATPLSGKPKFTVTKDQVVSMNMFGFIPSLFTYLEEKIKIFFEKNKDNLEKCEFLIPDIVAELVNENKVNVSVVPTNAKWLGITYKEDIDKVVKNINSLIQTGEYSQNLWDK